MKTVTAYRNVVLTYTTAADVKSQLNTRDLELATLTMCMTLPLFPQTHHTIHEERVTMTILVPTMANAVEGGHQAKLTPVPTLLIMEVPTQESQADQETPGVQDALAFRTHP